MMGNQPANEQKQGPGLLIKVQPRTTQDNGNYRRSDQFTIRAWPNQTIREFKQALIKYHVWRIDKLEWQQGVRTTQLEDENLTLAAAGIDENCVIHMYFEPGVKG